MTQVLSKVGSDHVWCNKNNQDYFLVISATPVQDVSMKMVLDGCGSGEHSEIGTRLFAQLFNQHFKDQLNPYTFESQVAFVMSCLLSINENMQFIANNLFFTIVCAFELEDRFIVKICGDGYVITQKVDNAIEYIPFDYDDYPPYVLYNFLPTEFRGKYSEGVQFKTFEFLKSEYINIGVATDGLRYMADVPDIERYRLDEFILNGKFGKIKMLINRNSEKFKDDITICM